MKFIKKILNNNMFKIIVFTFIEAFVGVIGTKGLLGIHDINARKTVIISAVSAGISAVLNFLHKRFIKES